MRTTTNKIIVLPTEQEIERTPGGIIIPKTSNLRKPNRGKVIAIGPLVQSAAVDDLVTYLPGSGVSIEVEEEKGMVGYLVLQEMEVLTVN